MPFLELWYLPACAGHSEQGTVLQCMPYEQDTILSPSGWNMYLNLGKHLQIKDTIKKKKKKKKKREKSRKCHNHKPQPFPDIKRKRKPQIQTSTNRSNVRKALRLALSSPSKVITMLKGLKNTRTKWHKVRHTTNRLAGHCDLLMLLDTLFSIYMYVPLVRDHYTGHSDQRLILVTLFSIYIPIPQVWKD